MYWGGKRVVDGVGSKQISCDGNSTVDCSELKSSVLPDGEMTLDFKLFKPGKNQAFYMKPHAHR
jgi:hypothetical protein